MENAMEKHAGVLGEEDRAIGEVLICDVLDGEAVTRRLIPREEFWFQVEKSWSLVDTHLKNYARYFTAPKLAVVLMKEYIHSTPLEDSSTTVR
mmetsp:Transcript_4430/g.13166  ORF Transcript_4430/g.13166 Transcript_4430/m.13166 type:complete len:93 (-) Transcript_4430:3738-4016(-)